MNGVRVAGPFTPTWNGSEVPKLVLLDSEGLGHTPASSSAVSTAVSRRIEATDAVLLVDSATQPMQAAPLAAMREVVATGNARKLIIAFTHFDEVKGDNLPNASARVQHVLASAENVLAAFGEELGPYAERALRQRLESARFFFAGIHEPLSEATALGRRTIVLACAVGASNTAVAARLGVGAATVGRWRRRYRERGLEGLHDELRPGRPRTYDDERVATVINDALQTKPPARTHWSVRAMASHSGISKSTVQRWFKLFGLQPHRHQYFKLSTDPFFIEKVRDIVGLYLDPPDHAVVLCVDEKSQTQALQQSQPVLPMGLGYVEGVTHDYWRHGTTTLFAALEVATGTVITDCKTRHRHQEFLGFLRRIDANVPADLDVHLIVDNYVTHKHARVKAWLAKRPRYHVHYTPTYASWINQVERWFGIITEQAIRRGSFRSVPDLVRSINRFVEQYNAKASPFVWTATAQSILAKVERLASYISGTSH